MTAPRFNTGVLDNDPIRRTTLLGILEHALADVEPDRAVRRALRHLEIAGNRLDKATIDAVRLLAFGKAAPAMARAAVDELAGTEISGLVVSNHGEPLPDGLELRVTGHPLPDQRSADAAQAALELLHGAGERDLVLCLISGGGSALLELPAAGVALPDVQATVDALLSC
ncbi:MAG: glycerate-2-kinase family protein, partial [Acidimicrobiia bacterium]|nr:glycerate-2-kinase family protein [Acidimicrobiia bacterium]